MALVIVLKIVVGDLNSFKILLSNEIYPDVLKCLWWAGSRQLFC